MVAVAVLLFAFSWEDVRCDDAHTTFARSPRREGGTISKERGLLRKQLLEPTKETYVY
jgi:hypothetical protein